MQTIISFLWKSYFINRFNLITYCFLLFRLTFTATVSQTLLWNKKIVKHTCWLSNRLLQPSYKSNTISATRRDFGESHISEFTSITIMTFVLSHESTLHLPRATPRRTIILWTESRSLVPRRDPDCYDQVWNGRSSAHETRTEWLFQLSKWTFVSN